MALLFTPDRGRVFVVCAAGLLAALAAQAFAREARPRCRDVGIVADAIRGQR